jgi:hypothetical protein
MVSCVWKDHLAHTLQIDQGADSKHSNMIEQEFTNSFGKMINSTKMQNLHDG